MSKWMKITTAVLHNKSRIKEYMIQTELNKWNRKSYQNSTPYKTVSTILERAKKWKLKWKWTRGSEIYDKTHSWTRSHGHG